jgi:hypothetical protein
MRKSRSAIYVAKSGSKPSCNNFFSKSSLPSLTCSIFFPRTSVSVSATYPHCES